MNWAVYALGATVLFSSSVLLDSHLLSKQFKNLSELSLTTAAALAGLPFLLVFFAIVGHFPSLFMLTRGFGAGLLVLTAYQLYYIALRRSHPAIVTTLFQLVLPFNYLFGVILFKESIGTIQFTGLTLVAVASVKLSLLEAPKKSKKLLKSSTLLLMTVASGMVALSSVVFKQAAEAGSYKEVALAEYSSSVVAGILLYLLLPKVRRELKSLRKQLSKTTWLLQTNEAVNLGGVLLLRYATFIGPLALVQGFLSLQPFFVLIFSSLIGIFVPKTRTQPLKHPQLVYMYFFSASVGSILLSL